MGTSAIIHFEENKHVAVYSHYDGYESGMAHKLLDAIKLMGQKLGQYDAERVSLFNLFMGANWNTARCEEVNHNIGTNFTYWISDEFVSYRQDDLSGKTMRLDDFINDNLLSSTRSALTYFFRGMSEDGTKKASPYHLELLKSYLDFAREEFEPILMMTTYHKYTNKKECVVMTLRQAKSLREELKQLIEQYGPDNPNTQGMINKVDSLDTGLYVAGTVAEQMDKIAFEIEETIQKYTPKKEG